MRFRHAFLDVRFGSGADPDNQVRDVSFLLLSRRFGLASFLGLSDWPIIALTHRPLIVAASVMELARFELERCERNRFRPLISLETYFEGAEFPWVTGPVINDHPGSAGCSNCQFAALAG